MRPATLELGGVERPLSRLTQPLQLDQLLPGEGGWEVEIGFGKGRYLLRRATRLETVVLVLAAACLFWPDIKLVGGGVIPAYLTDALGGGLLTGVILLQRFRQPAQI